MMMNLDANIIKVINVNLGANAIKVIDASMNETTRWILLTDHTTLVQGCLGMLKELKKLYNHDQKQIISTKSFDNCYYDMEHKCLKSTVCIKKDTVIFQEQPLSILRDTDIEAFNNAIKPLILKTIIHINNICSKDSVNSVINFFMPSSHIALLSTFSKLSLEIQSEILSLSSTLFEDIPIALHKALYFFTDMILNDNKIKGFGLRKLLPDTIVRLMLIFSSNVFGSQEDFGFVALFKKGCRINHCCCSSNAYWTFDREKESLLVISTKDILAGQEISQCYFDRERWYSSHMRKSCLKESRYFSCCCSDCTSTIDEHRNFFCSQCKSLGTLVTVKDKEKEKLNCLICQFVPDKEVMSLLQEKEKSWEEKALLLATDPSNTNTGELESLYDSLILFGPLHWTNCEIADYLSSICSNDVLKIGLIYRRICSLNFNSKKVTTNIAIGAIISFIDITQNLIERSKKKPTAEVHIKKFIKNEKDFILKVNNINITCPTCDDDENHYIVFWLLVFITLQSFFIEL